MTDPNPETLILTDYLGVAIRLSSERQAHILEHPEMIGQLQRIQETVLAPEMVVATNADPTVHVYQRLYPQTPVTRKFMSVIVKMNDNDAFVLTAFFSSRQKKGQMIWQP